MYALLRGSLVFFCEILNHFYLLNFFNLLISFFLNLFLNVS